MFFHNKNIFLVILIFITFNNACAITFAEKEETKEFIQQMVKKHGFDKKNLTSLFKKFEPSEEIIQKISQPYEEKPWHYYYKLFITEKRINDGVNFWKKYKYHLKKAEQIYGVPAEIIIAILGVETSYGENIGKYPVLQSLATLAFDYPKRSAFFKSELEQYLLLTREQKLHADKIKGSYAGAIGLPQFISSSYRNFAVDFANSGKIDLINNVPNAIGSVANYFKVNGWKHNKPIVLKATIRGRKYKTLLTNDKNPKPTLTLNELKQQGIYPISRKYNPSEKVSLLELDTGKNKEYWLGRENFYVITRYNHSINYAMAVYELSQELSKRIGHFR